MKFTVKQIKERAAFHLGDPHQRKFTNTYLQDSFASAYEELYDALLQHQLPAIELIVTHTLAADLTELDPADASITNFGELVRLEERKNGTSDHFVTMTEIEELPQRDPYADRLTCFEWRADKFYFVGSTDAIELRITYRASGDAPTTDSTVIGIDNAQNFLAYRMAAIAGPPKGYYEIAGACDIEARGKDGNGGALHRLLQPMVRSLNRVPVQQPAFSAGSNTAEVRGRPPFNM